MAAGVLNRTWAAINDADPDSFTRTFEEAELVLPSYLRGSHELDDKRLNLMRRLAADLFDETRAQYHTPMVNLLIKLFDAWTWQQVCDFEQGIPYKDGLAFGEYMVPFNKLMLCLLEKATLSAVDAAHAACMQETMQALVRLWLCTTDIGVSAQAGRLLFNLLRVDAAPGTPIRGAGQGLVWKRIFEDRDVYNVFFGACSLGSRSELGRERKTVAQARLLEWLPGVAAINWRAVSKSHHVDIEAAHGIEGGGLLDFAVIMVDYKDDLMMHRTLLDFFAALLHTTRPQDTDTMPLHDSVGLQYLITHGLHVRAATIYLQQPGVQIEPLETMLLYGASANYLATYASDYRDHFMASQMPKQINERLMRSLDLHPRRWTPRQGPTHDLHLMTCLPRKALLPNGSWSSSPLSLIPPNATDSDALDTLAKIFGGPRHKEIRYPPVSSATNSYAEAAAAEEAAAARALYFHYVANKPYFWQEIVTRAETIALLEQALAALRCLSSVITANWSTTPDMPLPTTTFATPASGHLAMLEPPAHNYVLSYLLKPAQTFSNLVGGRGDSESSVYQIAMAKFEALKALNDELVKLSPSKRYQDLLALIQNKLAAGPFSREGEVGGRIATLEF
ncbi:hypothetical protein LTR08_009317 [Meristemomyces frigidus]|nr:hypothetical protein LTR08_009317 [Meristemomyces frigidus]